MSPASNMGPYSAEFRQRHGTSCPPVMGPPGFGSAGLAADPGSHSLPDRFERIWEAAVAFREVSPRLTRPATARPGALPPHPRPSLKDGSRPNQPPGIFPAGQQSLPRNPRGRKGSLRSARGQTLAAPENTGQPKRCPTEKIAAPSANPEVVPSCWRTGLLLDRRPGHQQSSATATLTRAPPGPKPLANSRSHDAGGRHPLTDVRLNGGLASCDLWSWRRTLCVVCGPLAGLSVSGCKHCMFRSCRLAGQWGQNT